ncbi:MAG: endonuclease V [Candidatus Eisenbacteria bacterium]
MNYRNLHPWDVTTKQAGEIQETLRDMIEPVWDGRVVRTVAGTDVGFPDKQTVKAAVVVLTWPDLKVIATRVITRRCTFPYVPGLLAFREIPGLLSALDGIDDEPDVVFCDAQGIAHRRRMGLAAHLGILLDRPVLGCAKSVLYGKFEEPSDKRGSYSHMLDDRGEIIGAAVRTRHAVKPVYVSIGNRIDLETAIDMVLECSPKYRIAIPLRLAHKLSVGEDVLCGGIEHEKELI